MLNSFEIQQKKGLSYTEERNTFKREVVSDVKRKIEIEVGDAKQDEFYPQFKTKHWDNECNFSVRLHDDDYTSGIISTKDGKIEWNKGDLSARLYDIETEHEDGGFEFDIILNSKPIDNIIKYSIQSKGLVFFYQPALSEDEIKNGSFRPENVVGSYAVYHSSKKHNLINDKDYQTGKAFHIYRPWAEDSTGERVWCDLNIDEIKGEMTVSIPQDFLDTAVYPVLVDPTIGYTTIGASDQGTSASIDAIGFLESNFTGTIHSITAALKLDTGSGSYNTAWSLSDNTSSYSSLYYSLESVSLTTSYAWKTHDVSPDEIIASTDTYVTVSPYYFPFGPFGKLAYDSSTGTSHGIYDSSAGWVNQTTRLYSIYATYTEVYSINGDGTDDIGMKWGVKIT